MFTGLKNYLAAKREKLLAEYVRGAVGKYAMQLFGLFGIQPDVSKTALLKRYAGWAYICASRNASACAAVPLRLYAARGTGMQKARCAARSITKAQRHWLSLNPMLASKAIFTRAEDIEEIYEHPLLELLDNVNQFENGFDLSEKTSIFEDCTGDAYWYKVRTVESLPPDQLYCLPANLMTAIPDEQEFIKGWFYGTDRNNMVRFDQDEIVHFLQPNPNSIYYGMGCIEAAVKAVDRANAMDIHEEAINRNMGIPAFMVRYKDGQLTKAQRLDIEREWQQTLGGVAKSGKVKVADSNWEVQELGTKPREMGFTEGRKWTRLEIADAFGVPLALLDTENVNRANADVALTQYARFTILPRLRRREQKMNEQLVPDFNEPRLFLAYDNPVPDDLDFALKQEDLDLKYNVRTINEIRKDRHLDPVEWGDEPPPKPQPVNIMPGGQDPEPTTIDGKRHHRRHVHSKTCGCSKAAQPPMNANERALQKKLAAIFRKQKAAILSHPDAVREGNTLINAHWNHTLMTSAKPHLAEQVALGAHKGAVDIGKPAQFAINWTRNPKTIEFIDKYGYKFAQSVNQTTTDELKAALKDGFDAGESIPELKKRVAEVFDGYEQADRAEMIARTESSRAMNAGTHELWKESGVVEKEIWDAANDACEDCLAMANESKALNDASFSTAHTGIDTTYTDGDMPYPPAHPNCRCGMRAELTSEYQDQIDNGDGEE